MKNLKFGGVTVNDVNFNGTPVNIINFNGVKVWERETDTNALCFTAVQANSTIYIVKTGESILGSLSFSLEYSTDGTNWQAYTFPSGRNNTGPTITLANVGDKVYFRNPNDTIQRYNGTSLNVSARATFSGSGSVDVSGDATTLLKQSGNVDTIGSIRDLYSLFRDMTSLRSSAELQLPSTSLKYSCYQSMFQGCSNLIDAPELPATILAEQCYQSMFDGTAITSAPSLPATILEKGCYDSMFYNCTHLSVAPSLPATTLKTDCYQSMFYGCTALVDCPSDFAPTSVASNCCASMFYGCSNLTSVPSLPATTMYSSCYEHMFYNCRKITSAPELPATSLASSCYSYMFYGCSRLTTISSLPATILATECYGHMFKNCSKITSIEIAATTLATDCVWQMFYGCSRLSSIKVHFTDWGNEYDYVKEWVTNVSLSGTFICPSELPEERQVSRIPTNWTIQRI